MTTYRDDHEAALARLDTLEAEHAKLVAENRELRAKRRPSTTASEPPQSVAYDGEPLSRAALIPIALFASLAAAFIAYAFVA